MSSIYLLTNQSQQLFISLEYFFQSNESLIHHFSNIQCMKVGLIDRSKEDPKHDFDCSRCHCHYYLKKNVYISKSIISSLFFDPELKWNKKNMNFSVKKM